MTTRATPTMMTAPPIMICQVMCSSSISQPSSTATAGFTYSRLGRELNYKAAGAPEGAPAAPAAG